MLDIDTGEESTGCRVATATMHRMYLGAIEFLDEERDPSGRSRPSPT